MKQEMVETPEGETQEPAQGAEGGVEDAINGIMASADAMKTVAEAFMQMGQEGPAQKLMQASELASSALQEMLGAGGPAKGPAKGAMPAQDAMAAGSSKAVPVG
jgi:hypothetical protein